MPLDSRLLALLRCPETGQPLALASAELLERLHREAWPSRAGLAPALPCTEALLREDGRLLFPVREGLPILLLEEAIPVPVAT